MSRGWELAVAGGVATPALLWSVLVPWDLAGTPTGRVVAGVCGAVAVSSVAGGAVTFAAGAAGRAFVVAAYLTTLVLFGARSIAAHDVLWPVTLLLVSLVALGSHVVAFAAGEYLRTRSTQTVAAREKPPLAARVVVWMGLAVLIGAAGAFVWLFALGHGF